VARFARLRVKVAIGFFFYFHYFAWLYALLKLCLKGFKKGFSLFHTVIGSANSVVCYHFDKMVFYNEL